MSRRKHARRLARWRRYVARYDRLLRGQQRPVQPGSPMRVTPGFFRAEGWRGYAMGPRGDLRHGA